MAVDWENVQNPRLGNELLRNTFITGSSVCKLQVEFCVVGNGRSLRPEAGEQPLRDMPGSNDSKGRPQTIAHRMEKTFAIKKKVNEKML